MSADAISVILQGLNYAPAIMEVGKDIWKRIKDEPSKSKQAETLNGVVGNSFYSNINKFQISIPDDNWRFWEPTPQYVASLGTSFALPGREVPVMILSKNMLKLYRPTVTITIEDVGSYTAIQELADVSKFNFENEGYTVDKGNVKVSGSSNSAALIATGGNHLQKPVLCAVEMIYLYACKAYYIIADYVPENPESPQMYGTLQDIMNSFKLLK